MNVKADTRSTPGDIAGIEGAPDAIEAALAKRQRGLTIDPAIAPARGVEWVRPTDLVALGGSWIAGAGIDCLLEIACRDHTATSDGMLAISHRARKLHPDSALGSVGKYRGDVRSTVGLRCATGA